MGHGLRLINHAAAGGDHGVFRLEAGADGALQGQKAVDAVLGDQLPEQGHFFDPE